MEDYFSTRSALLKSFEAGEISEEFLLANLVRPETNSPTGYMKGGSPRLGTGTPVMPDGSPWTGQSMLTVAKDPQKAAELLQQIQQEYVNQFEGTQVGGEQAEKVNALQNEFTNLFPDSAVGQGVLNQGYKEQQAAIDKYLEEQRLANEAIGKGGGLSLSNIGDAFGKLAVKMGPAIGAMALAQYALPSLLASSTTGAASGVAGGTATGTGLTAGTGVGSGGIGLTGGAGGSTGLLYGTGAAGLSGAGSASGIAATQALAGLGVASGSALPAAGMAVGALPSTVGQLSAAMPASGSLGGTSVGFSSQLAPGTILGSGLPGGGAIGASYALGANGLPATNLLGTPIPASSIGISNIPETVTAGLSLKPKDILDIARIGSQVLGGAQPQQTAAPVARPQSIIPRGQVDYSGILNLLQARSPQRNMYSLLG